MKVATPKYLFKACLDISFSKKSYHVETIQLISKASHLTDSYMIWVFY